MVDQQFDGNLSLMQLKCSGMTTVLELMEYGYPSRTSFSDLHNMYKQYLPKELSVLTAKQFCEVRIHSSKIHIIIQTNGYRPNSFTQLQSLLLFLSSKISNLDFPFLPVRIYSVIININ